jgi:hypothetical protein
MALLRREPREVYRVYEAEDFLAGADGDDLDGAALEDEDLSVAFRPPPTRTRGRGLRTLGTVVLTIGVGAACGMILARDLASAVHGAGPTREGARPVRDTAPPAAFADAASQRPARRSRRSRARRTAHRRSPRAALTAGVTSFPVPEGPTPGAGPSDPPQTARLEFGFER